MRSFFNVLFFLSASTFTIFQSNPLIAEEKAKEFLILNETMRSGFGAELSMVIGALYAYEKGEYAGLEVNMTSGLFFDPAIGPNWWEYYFMPIRIGDKNAHSPHYNSLSESGVFSDFAYNHLSRAQNYELIQKYVHVKPEIQAKVDEFVEANFKNYFVIGVHHRGTDKSRETSVVPWDITLRVLQHTIENLPKTILDRLKVYVATDDQHFLEYLLEYYPSWIIYGNFHRSTDNLPLHYGDNPSFSSNYEIGKEAIIEALILSKCDALIRPSPSGFSWMPTVFSPNMPVNPIWCGGWVYPGPWFPPLHY